MRRLLQGFVGAAAIAALDAQVALAQIASKWPDFEPFERGSGHYLSWLKIVACWLLFLVWVSTSDWVNVDSQQLKLKWSKWNSLVVFPFIAAFILLWVIPLFAAGFPLLLIAYAVPLTLYIRHRNDVVPPHRQVMTADHLRFMIAVRLNAIGFNIEAERKDPSELGPPVKLSPQGAPTDRDNQVNLLRARQSEGFMFTRELLYDALSRNVESVLLDYTAQSVAIRYEIDGIWHNVEPRDRESGDLILAVMKTIAALNPEDRRSRQEGTFGAEYQEKKYAVKLLSQGTKTGERVMLRLEIGTNKPWTLDAIGMRDKMQEQLRQCLNSKRGFFLFSAPPRGGLTTTINAALNSADRYVRAWVAVEDAARREDLEIENIPVTTYDSAAGETAEALLPKLIRTYPDAIVMRDLVSADVVSILCDQYEANRFVVGSIRAKESVEALLRVLMMKVPPAKFAPTVVGVLNQRLVRKLCETCKEAYAPPPQVLQQLRLPAGRIEAFYRPRQPNPDQPDEVCPDCAGVGYRGRTAIFELLVADDAFRTALAKTPKLDVLRAAARKAGMRTLQEEGIVLVVKGVTSLQEVMRVLKE